MSELEKLAWIITEEMVAAFENLEVLLEEETFSEVETPLVMWAQA